MGILSHLFKNKDEENFRQLTEIADAFENQLSEISFNGSAKKKNNRRNLYFIKNYIPKLEITLSL